MRKILAATLALALLASPAFAATVTHEIGTADTGVTPNVSGAFVPVIGDLLVVCVVGSASVAATGTVTSSVGMTFTQITRGTYATNVNSIWCFVSDALVSNAASQTVTFDSASDPTTGTVIFVEAIAGMTRTGLAAIRQSAVDNNGAASTTPTPAFSIAALTGNPTIGVVGNNTSPATMTPPTSWTEGATTGDLGYATPTTGGEVVFRNSGFTGTTVTWGSASASVNGAVILELDTSAAPAGCGSLIALLGAGCK